MKVYQYDTVDKANQALANFEKSGISVLDVKITSVDNTPHFFIFTVKDKSLTQADEKQEAKE